MIFTAEQVFQRASMEAPELDNRPVEPAALVDAFNSCLRAIVAEAALLHDEFLVQEIAIPSEVVGDSSQDDVDLTFVDDDAPVREWIRISYIDFVDSAGESNEVWMVPVEARNRAGALYEDNVIAMLIDRGRTLRKLGGWDGVSSLLIYGVVVPDAVTRETQGTAEFDYPSTLLELLRWDLLVALAPFIGVDDRRMARWESKREQALVRMTAQASSITAGMIEEMPGAGVWL